MSLEHLGEKYGNKGATVLAEALDSATAKLLEENKSPSRKVNEIDNRGSHYYLAMYWAEMLAQQDQNEELKTVFAEVASKLAANENTINEELIAAQGEKVEIGGYFQPNEKLAADAMRASDTLRSIIDSI